MSRLSIIFDAPRHVHLERSECPAPAAGQLHIRSICSGISGGTEMLIYRGEAPTALAADATLSALQGSLAFPLKYGYAVVGDVIGVGPAVDERWLGQRVFAFNPHESEFVANANEVYALPKDLPPELGVMLPNVETALNLVQDGRPIFGEDVVVLGQGVVGLLTTALLARMPLGSLRTIDRLPHRRELSLQVGAHESVAPDEALARWPELADLCYEVSGSPHALNDAIALTGFTGRVLIGSWYGTKTAPIDLGGRFHRSRIQLISSQVSSIAPALQTRWDHRRRMTFALHLLQTLQPKQFITHRIAHTQATEAYRLLDEHPNEALQVVLMWGD